MIFATDHGSRPDGTPSSTACVITVCCRFERTSTVGESPVTVTVSCTLPTPSFALIVATNVALTSMSLRSSDLNPCNSNTRLYAPGGSRSNRYVPVVSVVCVCAPPISLSPVSDTVAPGRTALLSSVTTPVIDPVWTCAYAGIPTASVSIASASVRTPLMPPLAFVLGCIRLSSMIAAEIQRQPRVIGAPSYLTAPYTEAAMKRIFFILFAGSIATNLVVAAPEQQTASDQDALVKQYCSGCHSEKGKAGGLSLVGFAVEDAPAHADVAEKMIRKLRAGMMPPAGARRPEPEALLALAGSLEMRIDREAALHPRPGHRPFQRLNRLEYARAVKDLLALDIDVSSYLPPDTISDGYDNIADTQAFSPALLDGYLRAAGRVAALAVGDADAESAEAHYRVPKTASQLARVDGAPLGTRGGLSVVHTFPADGDYVFRMDLHGNADGFLFGGPASGEQLELS